MRHQIEEAEHQYDLNRAAELKHGKLPELERQLSATQQAAEGDGPRLASMQVRFLETSLAMRGGLFPGKAKGTAISVLFFRLSLV